MLYARRALFQVSCESRDYASENGSVVQRTLVRNSTIVEPIRKLNRVNKYSKYSPASDPTSRIVGQCTLFCNSDSRQAMAVGGERAFSSREKALRSRRCALELSQQLTYNVC